jgi:hypothetical protein
MKESKYASVVVVLVVALLYPSLAMASPQNGVGASKTAFTGYSVFSGIVDEGEWTFLPSGNVRARGIVETYNGVSSDPRLTGVESIVSNANFKPAPDSEIGLAGNLWGTFHIENTGGAWDGTFTSEITEGGEYLYRGVAQGIGGYAGLSAHFEAYRNGHDGPFSISGWILER